MRYQSWVNIFRVNAIPRYYIFCHFCTFINEFLLFVYQMRPWKQMTETQYVFILNLYTLGRGGGTPPPAALLRLTPNLMSRLKFEVSVNSSISIPLHLPPILGQLDVWLKFGGSFLAWDHQIFKLRFDQNFENTVL